MDIMRMILLRKEQSGTRTLRGSWSKKKEMRKKLWKETNSISLPKQSNSHFSAGTERKEEEKSKPMKIMTARSEKISTLSQSGTREGKF
jgi:hypothetical protein